MTKMHLITVNLSIFSLKTHPVTQWSAIKAAFPVFVDITLRNLIKSQSIIITLHLGESETQVDSINTGIALGLSPHSLNK